MSMYSPTSSTFSTPSLARSNSTLSTSSSVYSDCVSTTESIEAATSFTSAEDSFISKPAVVDVTAFDLEALEKQRIARATSDYYDYALKLERLNKEKNQTVRDKETLRRREKRKQTRPLDFGPEMSRLIGHNQATLDSKLQFTEEEIKRVKMHMRRVRKENPMIVMPAY